MRSDDLVAAVAGAAQPLLGTESDFDPLLQLVGDARCVLIGEASHGTQEFYEQRALLTKRLITERGFVGVAAEADWPDAYRVNRYVRGVGKDRSAEQGLADFHRFPAWMWRNREVLRFVSWLRAHNESRSQPERLGFYGLDLYSLHASINAVLDYLDQVDPSAAARARARYACLDRFQEEPESYGYVTALGLASDCERQVLTQLADLQQQRAIGLRRDGLAAEDEHFEAEQNARVVKDAEKYYRSMFGGRIASWNLRDTHMADTFDALLAHLGKRFDQPKLVVWAHNSHVGDARGTALGAHGELSLGQLARERHPGQCCLIGFSTYGGTVTAAADWGGLAERKVVNAALPESYEDVFHRAGIARFLLDLRQLEQEEVGQALTQRRLQRAIGVVYRPETERASHYFHAQLPRQFDAIIHIDQTRALEPLERASAGVADEASDTFPSGL